jgi:hypothetical protein
MPRLRLRIHPTGHVEVEVEGMGDGCHALVEEAAAGVGVILERRPLPPGPSGVGIVGGDAGRRAEGSAIRIGDAPSAG